MIKNWKNSGAPSSPRKTCRQKITLNDRDGHSLKRLAKSNRRKATEELRAVFNSESKSITIRTMRRELKESGLNSCVSLRKPLISEADRKKGFNLLGSERLDLEQWKRLRTTTVQACGGSAMIWGCCSWSGLGSATVFTQIIRSLRIFGMDFVHWWNCIIINTRFRGKLSL